MARGKLTYALLRRRLRPLLITSVVIFIIAEIVVLSPSSVEETESKSAAVDPETLMSDDGETLATGIPQKKIAEYSVDQFQYVSTHAQEKQWKLIADRAFLYNQQKLVHARKIHAFLFDPDGKVTLITGKEAKYFMNQRDLEVFGDVHTTFPDGFQLVSQYLRYRPNDRHVSIPTTYPVHGSGMEEDSQHIEFDSLGLEYAMAKSTIVLPKSADLTMEKKPQPLPSGAPSPKPDWTRIESDHAVIYRDKRVAHFKMYPSRPLATRFVRITQPTMFTRSRSADLDYGSFAKVLEYMVAYDDVFIKEIGEDSDPLKYATGGKAVFDNRTDVIRLTQFPQAYQDKDTITGDVIIMHRDSDLVEVENSNAFSTGSD